MSVSKKLLCFALLLIAAGCVPSLHALYSEQDVIFDPALLGLWSADGETMEFTRQAQEKAYRLVYTKDSHPGNFEVHLFKLKDVMFLDFYPQEQKDPQNDLYLGHFVPAHSFWRVDQIGEKLRLCDMDYDWTAKFLEANPKALAHEVLKHDDKDLLVLTASTKELQDFVVAHMNDKGFFGEPKDFVHQPAAATLPTRP